MRPRTRHLLLVSTFAVGACVTPPKPTPAPEPVQAPAPTSAPILTRAPPPPQAPSYANWRDAPQTPGDWSYLPESYTALFGGSPQLPKLGLACDPERRTVEINLYPGLRFADIRMRVLTETVEKSLSTTMRDVGPVYSVTLRPDDPLLDAMAYSSGRFAIEVSGGPTLYVPAWPEVMRVIDDCR